MILFRYRVPERLASIMTKNTDKEISFEKEKFLENFQGMEDLAVEAISAFIETLPKLTSEIDAALNSKDMKALEKGAHTLKGAASNFYATNVCSRAYEIEKMAQSAAMDELELMCKLLKEELDVFVKDLKNLNGLGGK